MRLAVKHPSQSRPRFVTAAQPGPSQFRYAPRVISESRRRFLCVTAAAERLSVPFEVAEQLLVATMRNRVVDRDRLRHDSLVRALAHHWFQSIRAHPAKRILSKESLRSLAPRPVVTAFAGASASCVVFAPLFGSVRLAAAFGHELIAASWPRTLPEQSSRHRQRRKRPIPRNERRETRRVETPAATQAAMAIAAALPPMGASSLAGRKLLTDAAS